MREAPPVLPEVTGRSLRWTWVGITSALLTAALLFFFNPAEHRFYPRCFFKMSTGLDCPGCGGLRATHQLLHGHIAEAFALNPLFVMAIPVGVLIALVMFIEKRTGRRFLRVMPAPATVLLGTALVIAFGILRNVSWRTWLGG